MEVLSNGIIAKYWVPIEDHPSIDRFVDDLIKVSMDSFTIIGMLKKVETVQKKVKGDVEYFKQITVVVNEIAGNKAESSIQIPDNKKEFMYMVDFDYAPEPVVEEEDFVVGDQVTQPDGKIVDKDEGEMVYDAVYDEDGKDVTDEKSADAEFNDEMNDQKADAIDEIMPEPDTAVETEKPEDAEKFEDDDFDKIFDEMEADGVIDSNGAEVNETKKAPETPKKAVEKPGPGSDLYTEDPDTSFEEMFGDDDAPITETKAAADTPAGDDDFEFDDPATTESATESAGAPEEEFNFDEFDKDGDPDFGDGNDTKPDTKTAAPDTKTESVPGLDFSDDLDDDDLDFS